MNRLENFSKQIQPKAFNNYTNSSQICPHEIRNIVFGPHQSYIQQIYQIIEKNQHIFNHADVQDQTRKVQRYNAARQMLLILKSYKITDLKKDVYKFVFGLYGLTSYSLGLSIKTNIQYMLYLKTLVTYGTTQIHSSFIKKAINLEHLGCFALTELHHGSYTKGIATQAMYNHQNGSFSISTQGNKGMKFWIGGSSQMANMAIIWAQVIVRNISYGPHPFVVQIRDYKTHLLMPGVIIGDCGDKFGLNGIDNGYFILEGVVVNKQNLLNALGGVDQKGNYISKIKSNQKRFGLHMSPLSSGRAALSYCTLSCSTNALAIAGKYVCQRRQFSNPNNKSSQQVLLIEYPLTKFRLIPLITQNLIYYIGGLFITKNYTENVDIFTDPDNSLVGQLHAFSAVLKAKSTWFTSKVITECRQLLGGHGYSSYSRLGRIYADNDVHMTWEGDNNMLLQQISKFLLKSILTKTKCTLVNLEFMWNNNKIDIDLQKLQCLANLENILKTILLNKFEEVKQKMIQLKQKNISSWNQWNILQPHFCNGLSLAFGDYIYFQKAIQALRSCKHIKTAQFLQKSLILWSLRVIQGFRYGKYEFRVKVQSKILQFCENLTADSLKFLDSIRPPDFIIDSPFVKQEPMKQYLNLFMSGKNTFKRVDWYEGLIKLKNS